MTVRPRRDDGSGASGAVSVVVPVYNAARFLAEAVRSATAEPETGEIILVEDGSSDASLMVAHELAASDRRIRVLRHPAGEHRGAGASRNLGIEAAAHDLVAFLDADDAYLPGRFRHAVTVLMRRDDVDGVYQNAVARFDDDEAREKWYARHASTVVGVRARVPPGGLFAALVRGGRGVFHTGAVTLRRRVFDRVGGFTTHATDQDVIMWCKIAAVASLVPGDGDEPVAAYRIHDANRSFHDPVTWRSLHLRRWDHLLTWAEDVGLDRGQRRLLAAARLRSAIELNALTTRQPARLLRDLSCLARAHRAHPSLALDQQFLKCVLKAFGARWVKRRAQALVRRSAAPLVLGRSS